MTETRSKFVSKKMSRYDEAEKGNGVGFDKFLVSAQRGSAGCHYGWSSALRREIFKAFCKTL